jgi:hypothetical protein
MTSSSFYSTIKRFAFPSQFTDLSICSQFVLESVPFLGEMNEKAVVSQVWNFHANSSGFYHGESKSLFPCCFQDSTSSPFQIPVSTFAYWRSPTSSPSCSSSGFFSFLHRHLCLSMDPLSHHSSSWIQSPQPTTSPPPLPNNSELSLAIPTLSENGRLTLPAINCRKDEAEVTEDIAIHGGTLRINIDDSAVRCGANEKRRRVPKVGLGRGNGCRSVLAYPVRPSRTVVRELGTVDIELEIGH